MRHACAVLLLLAAGCAAAAGFTFAALGDTPYNADEETRFIGILGELNRESPAFSIHVGDFKNGWDPCDDALFRQRKEWFELSRQPLIYVPGDNEWTDCWRGPGARHDPLERLRALRKLFFAAPESLGQRRLRVARQSDAGPPYPEHLRWAHDGVVFATLNMPGGDNNRARMPEESAQRTQAAVAWMRDAFRDARARRSPAVVLAMQANPWSRAGGVRASYARLMTAVAEETLRFSGEVLLIHGDTHRYRVDRPLVAPDSGDAVPNFTRIEVFGSPFTDWVRIRVDLQSGRARFDATPGSEPPAAR